MAMRLDRQWTVLAAAAAGILALGLGLGIAVGRHGDPAGLPTATPTATPGQAEADVAPSRGAAPTATATPAVTTADFRWVDFGGMRVPVSPTAGPAVIGPDGPASVFTETPTGALLAATHIMLRLEPSFGPRVYRSTMERQVVGPGKAAAGADIDAEYEQERQQAGVLEGQPTGGPQVRLVGFRLAGYSDTAATVHLLLRGADSNGAALYGDSRAELVWMGGDWRVVAPPDGDWGATTTLVASAAGFTPLGG
jgi:hypothetical protein